MEWLNRQAPTEDDEQQLYVNAPARKMSFSAKSPRAKPALPLGLLAANVAWHSILH